MRSFVEGCDTESQCIDTFIENIREEPDGSYKVIDVFLASALLETGRCELLEDALIQVRAMIAIIVLDVAMQEQHCHC